MMNDLTAATKMVYEIIFIGTFEHIMIHGY